MSVAGDVLDQEPLLYNLRPTRAQFRTTFLVGLFLLAAFLAALPFRRAPLVRIDVFIPLYDNTVLLGDWITATLLFAQAAVLRSKALVALATGYFFTGLIIIPHCLAFPFAFSPTGLLDGGVNNTVWLYLFWHIGLPLSVIGYTLLKDSPDWPHTAWLSPHKAIAAGMISAALWAAVLTLVATRGDTLLPQLMANSLGWSPSVAVFATGPILLLIAAAMALSWRRRSSALDLWLTLVLWGWFLELLLSTATTYRFGITWYFGRMIGLLSSLFMLLMLLAQTSKLYVRTVLQIKARQLEHENRVMIRDAIAASIAHELRQPLTAILLNAQTGQLHFAKSDDFVSSLLDGIVNDCHRATAIIESTRALTGKSTSQRTSLDINQLIRDSLALVSRTLRRLDVSVELRLDESLPPIVVNAIQMQQVFFNLFTNAAEAMGTVANRPRRLIIRSGSGENGVTIEVEDTGPGIAAADRERIFETFYTTKDQGTGLGLSICRSVIDAHGGRLHAMAGAATGATFQISLPWDGAGEAAI